MSGSTSTSLVGSLKQVYGPGSDLYQQNLQGLLLSEIEVSPDKPGGQGFFHMTMMRGNESGGAINEDERTADPQSPLPLQPIVTAKVQHWPFSFTGKAEALAQSDKFAFATTIDINVKDAQMRSISDRNRQAYGTGIGTMCQVNGAVVASTSVVVDNVQYLRENMVIDIFDVVGGTKEASSRTITYVDPVTNTITLDAAVTCSDLGIVVKAGVQDNAPTEGKEYGGLARIVDTTTAGTSFQNINRSTYSEYQSNVVDAGSVPLSQDLLQRLMNRIMIRGGATPNLIACHHGVYRSFVGTALAQTRYQDDELKTGHVKLTWNGIKWLLDKDCQTKTLYMLNKKPDFLARYVIKELDLADSDGKEINKYPGFDKYYGYFIAYDNFGSRKPNNHGKIINLLPPTY